MRPMLVAEGINTAKVEKIIAWRIFVSGEQVCQQREGLTQMPVRVKCGSLQDNIREGRGSKGLGLDHMRCDTLRLEPLIKRLLLGIKGGGRDLCAHEGIAGEAVARIREEERCNNLVHERLKVLPFIDAALSNIQPGMNAGGMG